MCFVKPGVVMFERDVAAEGVLADLDKENRRALELTLYILPVFAGVSDKQLHRF